MDVICLIQICSYYRKAKYDPTIEKPTNEYKKISQFRRYLPQVSNLNTRFFFDCIRNLMFGTIHE